MADVCIRTPSRDPQRVQELHTAVLHAMCSYVERQVAGRAVIAVETDQLAG